MNHLLLSLSKYDFAWWIFLQKCQMLLQYFEIILTFYVWWYYLQKKSFYHKRHSYEWSKLLPSSIYFVIFANAANCKQKLYLLMENLFLNGFFSFWKVLKCSADTKTKDLQGFRGDLCLFVDKLPFLVTRECLSLFWRNRYFEEVLFSTS